VDKKPIIKKIVDQRGSAYFTIYWSRLSKCDKYRIISSVPSDAGIYELYSMDPKGKLNLFYMGKSWYGGLRNELRFHADPETETDKARKAILDKFDCYYRYSLIESSPDMSDILFFFARTYFPDTKAYSPSGRYENIFVKEFSPDKIVTI
jgi:hypothetical protein